MNYRETADISPARTRYAAPSSEDLAEWNDHENNECIHSLYHTAESLALVYALIAITPVTMESLALTEVLTEALLNDRNVSE